MTQWSGRKGPAGVWENVAKDLADGIGQVHRDVPLFQSVGELGSKVTLKLWVTYSCCMYMCVHLHTWEWESWLMAPSDS